MAGLDEPLLEGSVQADAGTSVTDGGAGTSAAVGNTAGAATGGGETQQQQRNGGTDNSSGQQDQHMHHDHDDHGYAHGHAHRHVEYHGCSRGIIAVLDVLVHSTLLVYGLGAHAVTSVLFEEYNDGLNVREDTFVLFFLPMLVGVLGLALEGRHKIRKHMALLFLALFGLFTLATTPRLVAFGSSDRTVMVVPGMVLLGAVALYYIGRIGSLLLEWLRQYQRRHETHHHHHPPPPPMMLVPDEPIEEAVM